MHLFMGKILKFEDVENPEEDFWGEEKLMEIEDSIILIENEHPSGENMKEYRECQLRFLKELKKCCVQST